MSEPIAPDVAVDEVRALIGDRALVIEADNGQLFGFKPPSREAWSKCFNALAKDDVRIDKDQVMRSMVFACQVHPDGHAGHNLLVADLESYPGKVQAIWGELSDLAGSGESHVAVVDGQVVVEKLGHGKFVFRRPRPYAWARCLNTLSRDDRHLDRVTALEDMARDCLVEPAGGTAALKALFEDYPGISSSIHGELAHLAGAGGIQNLGKR